MSHASTLERLKHSFEKVISTSDKRTTVSPMLYNYPPGFSFLGDAKTPSLEGIRRFMVKHIEVKVKKDTKEGTVGDFTSTELPRLPCY